MKATYVIAILVALLLIAGCKQTVVEEKSAAPSPVQEAQETAEPAAPAAEESAAPIVEQKEDLSFENADATVQRLTAACKAGNAGVCAALKTKYGITVTPDSKAAEAETAPEAPLETVE